MAPSRRAVAAVLGVVVVVEVLGAIVLAVSVGWGWRAALETFVATNAVMGIAFGACGSVIAWYRPANLVGWLFLADGIGHATSALTAPLAQALADQGASSGSQRLAVTVFLWSWPWSIGLFMPLALMLFPDGRLPSPRWRPVAVGVIATAPLFALEMGGGSESLGPGLPNGYPAWSGYDSLGALWTAAEIRTLLALLLAAVALMVRYRRADTTARRQLQLLLLSTITVAGVTTSWSFVAGTPTVVLFAIPLIPVAVAVAILRHQLLDIRLVVSRAVTWLLLSLGVIAAYVLLVALLDTFVSAQFGRSVVATVAVALLVGPVLPRLQRLVGRAMYGDRNDPARVVSRVGQHLQTGTPASLAEVAESIQAALRVPHVAVRSDETCLGQAGGSPAGATQEVTLTYGQEVVGRLVIGLRPGERALGRPDQEAVGLIAGPLALAVHAMGLSSELKASRERLVAAREEERRRLRRDLHDGLGPVLTGLAFAADAAANLQSADPVRTANLLDTVRSHARTAITDVRRVVDDLRPPALDELGLVGALRQRADQVAYRADGTPVQVCLVSPDDLHALPAAIEVAAYRIATEALTNVVRHARATRAELRLSCDDTLEVQVLDNGPANGAWSPGIGLQGMRERTDELSGRFEAGPSESGGLVFASFLLETS